MINVNGVDIPNTVEELTVKQFDYISSQIENRTIRTVERWLNIFTYLGVPEESFDDYTKEMLEEAVLNYNAGFSALVGEDGSYQIDRVSFVVIEGYTYQTKDVIGVKDLSLIEKALNDPDKRLNMGAVVCAILFKRSDLDRKEHYADGHIKHKTALFKKQPSIVAIPYLTEVVKLMTNNAEELIESDTE